MKNLSNIFRGILESMSVLSERMAPWLKWKAGMQLRAIVVKANRRFRKD